MVGEIVVPSLGESVSEATVAKWFKKLGDAVAQDEQVLELETDKVTLEVNAPTAGVLKEIIAQAGASVKPGALLGKIEPGASGAKAGASPAPVKQAAAEAVRTSQQATPPTAANPSPRESGQASSSLMASGPAVRKLAEETSANLQGMQGSGRDGRFTKSDIQAAASAPASAPRVSTGPREERVRMSKLRQTIARRLKESQNTAAILTTFNEIDMSNVMALRNEYKDAFEKKHGVRLGFMSFFAKAAVNALKEIPAVNAQIDGEEIVYKNHYDIGIAVGTDQGLVVPVVRDVDQLSLAEIEAEINRLAKKAREGSLSMDEMKGGTFTITNGGVYGSLLATPIINPPQSGILGMHKVEERPIAVKGQVVIRPMMYVALSYDHRIIDGKESVTFLVRVKEAMEDPRRLLLGL